MEIQNNKSLILINVLQKPNFSSENLIKECLKYITEVQKGISEKCGSEPTNNIFLSNSISKVLLQKGSLIHQGIMSPIMGVLYVSDKMSYIYTHTHTN
jgi:hypothetical protein